MSNMFTQRALGRRTMLQGAGIGALGLAGAALIGCGSSAPAGGSSASNSGGVPVNTPKGTGLPMTSPVVKGTKKPGGTFTAHTTSTYTQHDPGTALATNIWHMIGEKGLEPDPQTGKIRPHVMTSWEVADPTTLVFKIQPGIKTHNMAPWNGREFTAEDVAWNLERIGGLYADRLKIPLSQFQRASMVAKLVKAQATDPTTVKVTLSKPNSSFFNGLMDTRVPFAPKEMDDIGWADPLKMGGIGPFQVSGWVKDQKMTYKKHPAYFRKDEPSFDNVEWTIIPDRASAVAAFISGQTNAISGLNQLETDQIKKSKPDANLNAWIDSNWHHMRFSVEYAPFKDFRVRRAMFLAVDYASIMDGFFGNGWGYQASLSPGFPEAWTPDKVKDQAGYNPATKAADRAEAQKMMTAAGFPAGKGIDFSIIYINTSGSAYPENVQRFQAQMKEVFPEMKVGLKPYADSASFNGPQNSGQFEMVNYVITAAPDAVIDMQSQYYTGGSRNYGHFSDKGLDALIDKAQVELNVEARSKLLEEFQTRYLSEWMPNMILGAQPARVMTQGNIAGFDTIAGTWYGYSANTKICRLFYVEK